MDAIYKGNSYSLTIPEGQLIEAKNLPTKQQFNKGLSDFWFDTQQNILHFREGQKKQKSIQIAFNQGKYTHEGIVSDNIYEIIVRTNLFGSIFGSSEEQFVAVTDESMKLPFEEQPWYVGAVDKGELKDILEAQTRMFFTRSKGPYVYLHWTTTKRLRNPEQAILLTSNDLSTVLPRGDFILARSNTGQVLRRTEALFCLRVIEGNLNGAKEVFEKGVDLTSPILREPYLLSSYIEDTPQEQINEELILWLLKCGVPVDRSYPRRSYIAVEQLIDVAASKCSDTVVEALITHGVRNSYKVLERAIGRNIPAHRMRIYFKSFSEVTHFTDYLHNIQHYRDYDYTSRVLVMLAWKFGNEENLFKQLPKELVKHIISYGIDDDAPWLDYVESLDLSMLGRLSSQYGTWSLGKVLKFAKIVWHYWHKISEEDQNGVIPRLLNNEPNYVPYYQFTESHFYASLSQSEMAQLVSWIIKLSARCTTKEPPLENTHLLSYIFFHHAGASILKALLDARCVEREWLVQPMLIWDRIYFEGLAVPLAWYAIRSDTIPSKSSNLPLIELLTCEGLMPEETTINGQTIGLSAYIKKKYGVTPHTELVMDLIQKCRTNPRGVSANKD